MDAEILHPHEAAALLKITTKQLRLLTDDGLLRWINVGLGKKRPTRRYNKADIVAFMEERSQKCPSTKGQIKQPIPTTSSYGVVDFRAILAHQQSEKRSASRKSGSRPQR